jgi:hypothetical protein
MRRFVSLLTAALVIVAAAVTIAVIRSRTTRPRARVSVSAGGNAASSTVAPPAAVTSAASWLASQMNDTAPIDASYFVAPHHDAVMLLSQDDIGADNTMMDVVILHGSFSYQTRGRPGAKPATGDTAYAVVNRVTGQVTDFGVMSRAVDLTPLGTATSFACCQTSVTPPTTTASG